MCCARWQVMQSVADINSKFGLQLDQAWDDNSASLLKQCRATYLTGVVLQAFGSKVANKVELRKKVVTAMKAFPALPGAEPKELLHPTLRSRVDQAFKFQILM